jgi:exosortase C (VPDSG-CTERM-specific)
VSRLKEGWQQLPARQRTRLRWVLGLLGVLTLVFGMPLAALMKYASGTDLHSHIVLIPFVSAYLLSLRWKSLPLADGFSPGWALIPLAAALAGLAWAWGHLPTGGVPSVNDRLGAYALAYVGLIWAVGFALLGVRWMAAAAFPLAFLIFLVPLPDGWTQALETASQSASADVSAWLFQLTGLPHVRDGNVFQLPGITIEVAQECSGIRSSWVLFITSLVAAEMFLKSPWRRFILVALVIPLGVLRNGFRILVISWLCVEVGPHMIDSYIHHRGGPIFFALSLIPLFLILWWLRRGEVKRERAAAAAAGPTAAGGFAQE